MSFFTNDVDTETQGADFVASYDLESGAGTSTFSIAANYNQTEITRRTPRPGGFFLGNEDVFDNENDLPNFRSTLGFRQAFNNGVNFNLRGNYYGEYANSNAGTLAPGDVQEFDSLVQWDFDVTWDVNEALRPDLRRQQHYRRVARPRSIRNMLWSSDPV